MTCGTGDQRRSAGLTGVDWPLAIGYVGPPDALYVSGLNPEDFGVVILKDEPGLLRKLLRRSDPLGGAVAVGDLVFVCLHDQSLPGRTPVRSYLIVELMYSYLTLSRKFEILKGRPEALSALGVQMMVPGWRVRRLSRLRQHRHVCPELPYGERGFGLQPDQGVSTSMARKPRLRCLLHLKTCTGLSPEHHATTPGH